MYLKCCIGSGFPCGSVVSDEGRYTGNILKQCIPYLRGIMIFSTVLRCAAGSVWFATCREFLDVFEQFRRTRPECQQNSQELDFTACVSDLNCDTVPLQYNLVGTIAQPHMAAGCL